VIGLLGGNTILQVSAIVYLGIPLGSLLVIAVVDSIIGPLAGTTGEIDLERRQTIDPPESDDRAKRYLHRRRVGEIRDRLAAPFEPLIERPALTLLVTVPTALIGIGILVDTGIAELSLRWMTARPVVATSILFVLPFGLISLPLSVFHELRQRRIKTLTNRFPETLAAVSNVNKIGLSLPESLSIVGQRRTDRLGTELVRLKNDIDWNGDIADGLGRFANRLRVPVIARTTKLFIEANRAGGDLHRSLSIAADDATSQRQLRRERKQELTSYLAVAIVGFLVYVGVVVLIDQFYLQGITQTIESSDARPSDPGLARSFVSLDVNVFRLLVFQSALIQAVFSGLVAGKLSDNAVLSGLKFSIALVLVTVIVFLFI
jgi:flagellar protein FlaJ